MNKTKIAQQLTDFLATSGISMRCLGRESGVNHVIIQRLVSGKYRDLASERAEMLRETMLRLDFSAARTAGVR